MENERTKIKMQNKIKKIKTRLAPLGTKDSLKSQTSTFPCLLTGIIPFCTDSTYAKRCHDLKKNKGDEILEKTKSCYHRLHDISMGYDSIINTVNAHVQFTSYGTVCQAPYSSSFVS